MSHRIYSTGFYYGEPGQYVHNSRYIRQWQICAVVDGCGEDGMAVCSLRNKFRKGDVLEVVGPDLRPISFTVDEIPTRLRMVPIWRRAQNPSDGLGGLLLVRCPPSPFCAERWIYPQNDQYPPVNAGGYF